MPIEKILSIFVLGLVRLISLYICKIRFRIIARCARRVVVKDLVPPTFELQMLFGNTHMLTLIIVMVVMTVSLTMSIRLYLSLRGVRIYFIRSQFVQKRFIRVFESAH